MYNFIKKQKGITLIALVITIIVLLILAGVAISMLSGENGILNQAIEAKQDMEKQSMLENIKLSILTALSNENHLIDKQVLEAELKNNYSNVKINGEDNLILEIDEYIYYVDKNGMINENDITKSEESSSTGSIKLQNALKEQNINYRIEGNSIQNGTPTLDTPIDIESVGEYDETTSKYKIPLTVKGKNLLQSNIRDIDNWIYNPQGINTKNGYGYYVDLKPGKYTFSVDVKETDDYGYLYLIKSNDNWSTNLGASYITQKGSIINNPLTFDVNEGESVMIWMYGEERVFYIYSNYQIEEGEKFTYYEPYIEPITTNIYLDEPLRKVGDYADYIDFENKKLVRNIKEMQLTSSMHWLNDYYPYIVMNLYTDIALPTEYKGIKVMNNYSGTENFGISNVEGKGLCFSNSDSFWGFANTDEAKSWLDKNKFIVNYIMKTPKEENIELPKIETFEGTNIITVDTKIKPSNFTSIYYKNM